MSKLVGAGRLFWPKYLPYVFASPLVLEDFDGDPDTAYLVRFCYILGVRVSRWVR